MFKSSKLSSKQKFLLWKVSFIKGEDESIYCIKKVLRNIGNLRSLKYHIFW